MMSLLRKTKMFVKKRRWMVLTRTRLKTEMTEEWERCWRMLARNMMKSLK